MSELKKSTDGTYMYEHLGQQIKMCMAIFCNKAQREKCVWHKRWQADRSMIGAYFGNSSKECDYYKSIE